MTTKNGFPVLKSGATKAEEIAWFEGIAAAVEPSNTYLADFFNKHLVGWVTEQIKNDFPPDLMDYYQGEQAKVSDLRGELTKVQRELDKVLVERGDLAHRMSDRIEGLERDLEQANQNQEAMLNDHMNQLNGLIDEINSHVGVAEQLQALVDARDEQIVYLKARLWDLSQK